MAIQTGSHPNLVREKKITPTILSLAVMESLTDGYVFPREEITHFLPTKTLACINRMAQLDNKNSAIVHGGSANTLLHTQHSLAEGEPVPPSLTDVDMYTPEGVTPELIVSELKKVADDGIAEEKSRSIECMAGGIPISVLKTEPIRDMFVDGSTQLKQWLSDTKVGVPSSLRSQIESLPAELPHAAGELLPFMHPFLNLTTYLEIQGDPNNPIPEVTLRDPQSFFQTEESRRRLELIISGKYWSMELLANPKSVQIPLLKAMQIDRTHFKGYLANLTSRIPFRIIRSHAEQRLSPHPDTELAALAKSEALHLHNGEFPQGGEAYLRRAFVSDIGRAFSYDPSATLDLLIEYRLLHLASPTLGEFFDIIHEFQDPDIKNTWSEKKQEHFKEVNAVIVRWKQSLINAYGGDYQYARDFRGSVRTSAQLYSLETYPSSMTEVVAHLVRALQRPLSDLGIQELVTNWNHSAPAKSLVSHYPASRGTPFDLFIDQQELTRLTQTK